MSAKKLNKDKLDKKIKRRKYGLKIYEAVLDPNDSLYMQSNYLHIKELHSIASKSTSEFKGIFSKELSVLRRSLRDDYAYKGWEVVLTLGKFSYSKMYPYYPDLKDLKDLRHLLLEDIKRKRAEASYRHHVLKDFQGMRYEMLAPPGTNSPRIIQDRAIPRPILRDESQPVRQAPVAATPHKILPKLLGGGCVFTHPNSIVDMLNSNSYAQRITRAKRPYDNANYVGVELEVVTKIQRETLNNIFVKNKLAGSVYVKHDGSIERESANDVTHEITLIAKEQNIYQIVKRVCDIVNSSEVGGYVNNSCGLHVHLDMRNRNPDICYENYKQSLGILAAMVPYNRTAGAHAERYCKLTCNNTFKEAFDSGDRYRAINAVSFGSHNTIEIRLHSGSTNASKINNWIELLLAIANKETTVLEQTSSEEMQRSFGISDDLVKYIDMRINKFKDRSLNTRMDHFETAI